MQPPAGSIVRAAGTRVGDPSPSTASQTTRPAVEITLPPSGQRDKAPPSVSSENVLADRRLQDLLHNGFPARLHFRVELWSTSGWFDDLEGQAEWDVVVRYVPLDRRYEVTRIDGDRRTRIGVFDSFKDVEAAVARPVRPPLQAPTVQKRFYYVLVLDVESLSVKDLDEVAFWLEGELAPAVRGKKNPGTAVTRGVRTFLARLLGSQSRHYEARTISFVPK
jgi:hypothetical protein